LSHQNQEDLACEQIMGRRRLRKALASHWDKNEIWDSFEATTIDCEDEFARGSKAIPTVANDRRTLAVSRESGGIA
jgi:hypothetical protein